MKNNNSHPLPTVRFYRLLLLCSAMAMAHLLPATSNAAGTKVTDGNAELYPLRVAEPRLLYPQNDTVFACKESIMLLWMADSTVPHYELYICSDSTFSVVLRFEDGTVDPGFSLIDFYPPTSGTYYWRVHYVDQNKGLDVWSEMRRFTFHNPDIVTLLSPQNLDSLLGSEVLLRWTSSAYAEKYEVVVRRDSTIVLRDTVRDTTYTLQLKSSGLYSWQVRSLCQRASSLWSATSWFKSILSSADENFDGSSELLRIILNRAENLSLVFSMPRTSGEESDLRIILYGLRGCTIPITVRSIRNELYVEAPVLPTGVYVLYVGTSSRSYVKKIYIAP